MINLQDLTLKEIDEIKNIFLSSKDEDICSHWIGKYVIIRTYSAGVHCGVLNKKVQHEVLLTSTRRIWSWEGAFTLNEISDKGLDSKSKLSVEIPVIKLTEIEIIPCSEKSMKSLKEIQAYIP